MDLPISSGLNRFNKPAAQAPEVNLIPREYLDRRIASRDNMMVGLIVLELFISILLIRSYGGDSLAKI